MTRQPPDSPPPSPATPAADGESTGRSLLPVAGWLRGYGWTTLRFDVLAGITLAAYLIPAGIGDASLARLPPEAGLY
ncbi:MAG TPA: SulP family inorganic anion transporter, partial [Phycisphaerales bacterium]|nr:SulP family inorganic anion transporter [Phycisphaerales bacterium]